MVPHLSFVRGSPPRSDAAERGRYADEDPLTFLDQVGGSLEESAGAGRGVSSYRPTRFEAPSTARNQLVRLYGPSRRPTSAGSHRCTASDCHTGPSARARRARSCGGARAAVVHTPARRWYSLRFYSPVSGAVYSATGAHSVPWLRRRDCEHDRSVVARRGRTAHCPMGSLAHFGLRLHCCRLSSRALDAGNPRAGLQ